MNRNVEILVVEDSLTQAEQLRLILEKENYKVKVAKNGVEALELIDESIPDLIVTDILMPKMDGYELCQKIKSDDKLKNIPVILLTSLADPIDVIRGLKVRADNFITKPYKEEFLISRIQHMLINIELRKNRISEIGIEVFFEGEKYFINSERIQIIDLLLSTFENAVQKTKELEDTNMKLRKAFKTIRKLEKNYKAVLESSKDALLVINYNKQILYSNPASEKLFGENYKKEILDILNFDEIEDSSTELTLSYPDGSEIIVSMRISETDWEGKEAYLLSIRDVTEEACLREQLKIQSLTDELTKLYNRRGFLSLIEHKIKLAKLSKKGMILFFVDIDDMKSINDNLSHNCGDRAIIGASNILKDTFSENDIVARLGGDEFAVLAVDVYESDIKKFMDKLLEKQELFNEKNEYCFSISMSVGATYFNPEDSVNVSELIEEADKQMYEHKKNKHIR
ncbi:diguanylate cyclase [Clostridium sp. P21]|uniref:Stage 0 sporulation protein A homolog n=1 Tax=Clostridium muellerianum TaxID=2716538 RepID=A0A7Y0EIC5_9CLOT|nr:diguanylate cyclase [Clostridium muellerianum]NMM63672.1 diguanylate cyclase [Clostridium muellerianum]